MKRSCRFCEAVFYIEPEKFDKIVICSDCLIAIKNQLKEDPVFQQEVFNELKKNSDIKYQFLESALGDQVVLGKIGRAIMEVQVKDIGLGGSGTLAEFFLQQV